MRLAYLILAHEDPQQFYRLIRALDAPGVYFFIHIDAKSDISHFSALAESPNVTYVEQRINVNHGGFSMTKAMINLLTAATLIDPEPDYFILLSGLDYPIKSNAYIHQFLESHWPMNFIDFYPLIGDAPFARNIKQRHFVDFAPNLLPVLRVQGRRFVEKLASFLPERQLPKLIPYRGSQWWCLNKFTVKYIMDFIQDPDNQGVVQFFHHTWGSDEILVQTIVLNSPHASQCRVKDGEADQGPTSGSYQYDVNLHYVDWSPTRENPAVFRLDDFNTLIQSDKLFVRKVRTEESGRLLDAIDYDLGATKRPDALGVRAPGTV